MKKEIEYQAIVNKNRKFTLTKSVLNKATILFDPKGFPTQIIFDDHCYDVQIDSDENAPYKIKVDGISFEVDIKRPIHVLVDELGFNKPRIKSEKVILSPMPGQIISLNTAAGRKVAQGENLLTLEAMKMENTIQAPMEGIVKEIFITPGDTVIKGQKLLEIQ